MASYLGLHCMFNYIFIQYVIRTVFARAGPNSSHKHNMACDNRDHIAGGLGRLYRCANRL